MQTTALVIGSALIAVALGCTPINTTPGLRLGGQETAAPRNFRIVDDHEEITLATKGSILPRVVTVWGVAHRNALYVWGDPESGWTQRVAKRPDDVRVRIGDNAYALKAKQVTDGRELKRVVDEYSTKYGQELIDYLGRPATVDDFTLVYRLTPRD